MSELEITHISIDSDTGTSELGYVRRLPRRYPAFPRIVTAERAGEALKRFIDRNFNRSNATMPRFCIPVEPDDDDMVLSDYIDQAEQRAQFARRLWYFVEYYSGRGEEYVTPLTQDDLREQYAKLFPDA